MEILFIIICLLGAWYGMVTLLLLGGLRRLKQKPLTQSPDTEQVSVVLAARDEEAVLAECLEH